MARVAILTSSHPSTDTRIFQKEARSIAAGGHQVWLVVPESKDEEREGVSVVAVKPGRGRWQRWLLVPPRVLRAGLRLPADAYHFHDPELIPAGLILRLLGKRVVYDVHEDVPRDLLGKQYIPAWLRRPLAAVVGWFQRSAARCFNLIVLAREDIRPAFGSHPHTVVISNYPSRSLSAAAEQADAASHDGPIRVSYVGGMSPVRGIRECVQSLAHLPAGSARFDFYGRLAPPAYADAVTRLPEMANATFHGPIAYDRVPQVLGASDIGIVCFLPEPNNINSGPTKLFEYMACGLPVVASDFPEWRAVIERAECGVCVDPTNPADIARGIQSLGTDRARLRAVGARGRAAVQSELNWETEADRLLEAYRELLAR